jgi:Acetyltransferases, including N-acetylases of ribosomal proteins
MITRIHVIGLGLGHPDHLTHAAIAALNGVDVFLLAEEGEGAGDRGAAQRALCAELLSESHAHRFVEVTDQRGEPDSETSSAAYDRGKAALGARVEASVDALGQAGPREETLGLLVWGDPALASATLALAAGLAAHFHADVEVAPGLGAPQLLAAAHRISLGSNGADVRLMSAQHLVDSYDPTMGDAVVVDDDRLRCLELADLFPDLTLYWGAHLGTADEVLVAGRFADVVDEVRAARSRAAEAREWVVDAYLLRPPAAGKPAAPSWPTVDSLSDGVLTLRPMTTADWDLLLAENNNDEAMKWGFTADPMTEPEARQAAARAVRDWRSGRAARFTMVDGSSGVRAGMISVLRMGPPEVALIGYGVLPEFRGRGLTVRALELLVDWVFATTSIARLELGHKLDNVASGVVASRAGFVREGVLAGRLKNPDGSFADEVSYARLRPAPSAGSAT